MSFKSRLDKLYKSAKRITVDPKAKLVFLSDFHMGDGGPEDDFIRLDPLCYFMLNEWWQQGFILVTLGDMQDLWECSKCENIPLAHPAVIGLLQKFDEAGRSIVVDGNHDRELKNPKALVLQIGDLEIFCVHGNQGDLFNDRLWWVGRYVVRYLWTPLQWIGLHDPTESKFKKHQLQKKRLAEWARDSLPINSIMAHGHDHVLDMEYGPVVRHKTHPPDSRKRLVVIDPGSWVGKEGEAITFVKGKFEKKSY